MGSGPTLKERNFYKRKAWLCVRRLALQRDHYLCQSCLRAGRHRVASVVHHLKELEDFPELGLELSNLESLCWDCHEATKTRKGRKPKWDYTGPPEEPGPPGVRIIKI